MQGKLKFRGRRVSLTFRKVRVNKPCACMWPLTCDSQSSQLPVDSNLLEDFGDKKLDGGPEAVIAEEEHAKDHQTATQMEKRHVYDVYERIAPHFSNTRYKPWPKIGEYMRSLEMGSWHCDVGCGNGKYLGINAEQIFSIGTDRSFNLVDICRQRNF